MGTTPRKAFGALLPVDTLLSVHHILQGFLSVRLVRCIRPVQDRIVHNVARKMHLPRTGQPRTP